MTNIDAESLTLNPSNAKANCHQKNKVVTIFGNHLNISDEHPYAKVSIIFQFFASFYIGQISYQQHMG